MGVWGCLTSLSVFTVVRIYLYASFGVNVCVCGYVNDIFVIYREFPEYLHILCVNIENLCSATPYQVPDPDETTFYEKFLNFHLAGINDIFVHTHTHTRTHTRTHAHTHTHTLIYPVCLSVCLSVCISLSVSQSISQSISLCV